MKVTSLFPRRLTLSASYHLNVSTLTTYKNLCVKLVNKRNRGNMSPSGLLAPPSYTPSHRGSSWSFLILGQAQRSRHPWELSQIDFNPFTSRDSIMANARLSDKELANINAAAVTKEYRIKPHLGTKFRVVLKEMLSSLLS